MLVLIGYTAGVISQWALKKAKIRRDSGMKSWMLFGGILAVSDITAIVLAIYFW